MRKTLLIARREYLAFVRTIGFWLSMVTAPLILVLAASVPVLIQSTAPVEVMDVAILDLTGDMERPARDMISREMSADGQFDKKQLRIIPLPPGLRPDMTLAEAEAAIPDALQSPSMEKATLLLLHEKDGKLQVRLWSRENERGKLQKALPWQLPELQIFKTAQDQGLPYDQIREIRDARAEVISLVPGAPERDRLAEVKDNAPRFAGAVIGYLTWITIFSSSMMLLGGVIEEKASKMLEVLLASASTESLLMGKVLGVAGVMVTVGLIWGAAGFALLGGGVSYLPPEVSQGIVSVLSGLFSPLNLALLPVYFAGGYLMYGVIFTGIGAFCETQKDAQAIMGPVMIVLMIPLLSMQSAFIAPNSPLVQWLSWVPLFTPFLMPLRLTGEVPLWEIGVTLGGMAVAAWIMVSLGRRAFRQGALTGGKLSWNLLARLVTRRP